MPLLPALLPLLLPLLLLLPSLLLPLSCICVDHLS